MKHISFKRPLILILFSLFTILSMAMPRFAFADGRAERARELSELREHYRQLKEKAVGDTFDQMDQATKDYIKGLDAEINYIDRQLGNGRSGNTSGGGDDGGDDSGNSDDSSDGNQGSTDTSKDQGQVSPQVTPEGDADEQTGETSEDLKDSGNPNPDDPNGNDSAPCIGCLIHNGGKSVRTGASTVSTNQTHSSGGDPEDNENAPSLGPKTGHHSAGGPTDEQGPFDITGAKISRRGSPVVHVDDEGGNCISCGSGIIPDPDSNDPGGPRGLPQLSSTKKFVILPQR